MSIDVGELVAGRDLDALAAEKMFGCKVERDRVFWQGVKEVVTFHACTCDFVDDYRLDHKTHERDYYDDIKPYSTDIVAAWEILTHPRFVMQTIERGVEYAETWHVEVGVEAPDKGSISYYQATAATVPLAICRAALRACL